MLKKPFIIIGMIIPLLSIAQDDALSLIETTSSPVIEEREAINTGSETESMDTSSFQTTKQRRRWSPRSKDSLAVTDKEKITRSLDLRSVLEEGFRKNPFEQIREQRREQIDLRKKDVNQGFWLPKVSLEMLASNHRVDRFRTSSESNPQMGAQQAPTGSVGLVMEEYSLFNWGRDYLQYLNDKSDLTRQNQQLLEARRRLKFNLITQYFNLIRIKEISRIKLEQLRQTSFIHRLAREKLNLRKIRAQEYYQTRSEYLRAQTEYQQAQYEVGLEEERMANFLGDDYQAGYRTIEQLKYTGLNANLDEAVKYSLNQSVPFRDAKLAYDNASRTYEKTVKDNLPLPKLSFNLGAYRTGFDPDGTTWNFETTNGSRNVELVAAINMKWTLIGENGFFNQRQNERVFLDKKVAEIGYYNAKREVEVKVRTIYKTIKFLEQKVSIAEFQYKNAQSNYDSTLDNYVAGRTTYPDIKLAIDNLVNSSVNSENVKYDHLLRKLELSDLMGLEDLPGENFEQLAVR